MKQKLNNTELDRIGKLLFTSAAVPESEIDRIVNDPNLFNSVRKRIAKQPRPSRNIAAFTFIRRNAITVSVVLCISIAAVSFGLLRTKSPVVAKHPADAIQPNPVAPTVTKFSEPDRVAHSLPSYAEVDEIRPQRTSNRVVPVRTAAARKPITTVHDAGDFYAVSYAGDPNETERGGRIIRVDMPRSALFAMGVDIPLENESEVIKADLLVGTDGVTRAIRVVK
jgi:hypothetical protein